MDKLRGNEILFQYQSYKPDLRFLWRTLETYTLIIIKYPLMESPEKDQDFVRTVNLKVALYIPLNTVCSIIYLEKWASSLNFGTFHLP